MGAWGVGTFENDVALGANGRQPRAHSFGIKGFMGRNRSV